MVPFRTRACAGLAAAMILAGAWQGSAQSPPPTPPPAQAQAPPAQTQAPPAAQPQTGQPDKPAEKPPRSSKRVPRTSKRQPSAPAQGSLENARPSRDGGPTRQDVTLTANVLGGYDDNLTAGLGSGSGTSPNAMVSGPTASVDGTLGYFRGNGLRSVQLDTTGSLTGYPGNLDSPAPAGVVNLAIRTPVGRDLTLGLSQRVSYDSLFNVLSPGCGRHAVTAGSYTADPDDGPLRAKLLELEQFGVARSSMGPARHDVAGLLLQDAAVPRRRLRRQHVARVDRRLSESGVVASQGGRRLQVPQRRVRRLEPVCSPHHRAQDRRRDRVRGGTVAPPQLHAVARSGCRLPRVGQR